MTAAARIRAPLAECQAERLDYRQKGDGILAAACAVREAALKQCIKIVEEGQ